MSKAERTSVLPTNHAHGYEFGGPLGAFGLSFVLPILVYGFAFLCNDISGCPAPSLLSPSTLTFKTLAQETGWDGIPGLFSWEATFWVLAYYALSVVMQVALPGAENMGTELRNGGRLTYKANAFTSAAWILFLAGAGTVTTGSTLSLWTFIWTNYIPIITVNILIALFLATFTYVGSFTVSPRAAQVHPKHTAQSIRELAAGGHSGNMIYDWFIGRELNPRVFIPFTSIDIDIKAFCELRPGMLGWLLVDLACMAHQFTLYGYVTDSMVLIVSFQALYIFDALWMEPAILTTMDITRDGFGYMLAFGDLAWLPFIYSLQARYLAVYPVDLGLLGVIGVLAVQGFGYWIFRSSNNEKNRFRTNPKDPRVKHLKYLTTKSGGKLLVSGWWGTARHINYLGDWIMAWSYCLPTGMAGYVMVRSPNMTGPAAGGSVLGIGIMGGAPEKIEAVQTGSIRGWGIVVTYFYVLYFTVLLVHREMRDEEKCKSKYGADWEEYKRRVRWRILPGVY